MNLQQMIKNFVDNDNRKKIVSFQSFINGRIRFESLQNELFLFGSEMEQQTDVQCAVI